MTTSSLKLAVWTLAMIILNSSSVVAQTVPPEVEQIFSEKFQRLEIHATVVDSAGKPIDGVSLDGSWFARDGFDGKSVRVRQTVNGEFALERSAVGSIEFEVRKQGYHAGYFSALVEKPAAGCRLENGIHHYELRFVLEPVLAKTGYHRFEPFLDIRSDGQIEVWDIHKSFEGSGMEEVKKTVAALSEIDGPGIYVHRDAAGNLEIVLEKSAGDEGFFRFAPTTQQRLSDVEDSMRVAPEGGYQKALSMMPSPGWESDTFFFCKLDGKFCKGYVTKSGAGVALDVRFQPDGTRFVDWPE